MFDSGSHLKAASCIQVFVPACLQPHVCTESNGSGIAAGRAWEATTRPMPSSMSPVVITCVWLPPPDRMLDSPTMQIPTCSPGFKLIFYIYLMCKCNMQVLNAVRSASLMSSPHDTSHHVINSIVHFRKQG